MSDRSAILFSAFEPSGDALAAPLIEELRRRDPARPIYAFGGPRMEAAGAELIESTTEHAVMLAAAAAKAFEHRARVRRLRAWMATRRLAAVVSTDSPAANWAVCRATRALQPQAKILHLAAPQLWAWAPWRIRKMRRFSDGVMCLLPFEPAWFGERGVHGEFVGHPVFDRIAAFEGRTDGFPAGAGAKLALLPGSREAEVRRNLPTMLGAVARLRASGVGIAGPLIAASSDTRARQIESFLPPPGDEATSDRPVVMTGRTDDALAWADVVLVVSGTAALQVVAHGTPMAVLYNASRLAWHGLGRWIVSTRTFSLPNLIGEHMGMGRRVPEFVPHFRAVEPVVEALRPLLTSDAAREPQHALFRAIHERYAALNYAAASADFIGRATRQRDA